MHRFLDHLDTRHCDRRYKGCGKLFCFPISKYWDLWPGRPYRTSRERESDWENLATMSPGPVNQTGGSFCSLQTTLTLFAHKKASSKTEGEEERQLGPRHSTPVSSLHTRGRKELEWLCVYVQRWGDDSPITSDHISKPSLWGGLEHEKANEEGGECAHKCVQARDSSVKKRWESLHPEVTDGGHGLTLRHTDHTVKVRQNTARALSGTKRRNNERHLAKT